MKHPHLTLVFAVMIAPACKPKDETQPTDTCDALIKARDETLEKSVKRYNAREIGLGKFVKSINLATYLDTMISDRDCPDPSDSDGTSGTSGSSDESGGADTDESDVAAGSPQDKFAPAAQTAIDSRAKDLNGRLGPDTAVTDHEVAKCLLGQQACAASGNPALAEKRVLVDIKATLLTVEKLLHGADNRRVWSKLEPREREAARATVALFIDSGWTKSGGEWIYPLKSLKDLFPDLCPDERFRDEPTASYCSGAVVGDRWIATARHCVSRRDRAQLRIVTGYGTRDGSEFKTIGNRRHLRIPAADYYTVDEIKMSPDGEDWALLKLDHVVAGVSKPLAVDKDKVTREHNPILAAIGHPLGLPLVYANDAAFLDVGAELENDLLFHASLDTYAGNSGSPIIDVATNNMAGILIRGDDDFVARRVGGCQSSRICGPGDVCHGEVVQRVHADSTFARALATLGASIVPAASGPPTAPPTKPAGRAPRPAARSK